MQEVHCRKRLVILTVGKTHSGKTTFAKQLEQQLESSVVIDQDNHAEFVNTHYPKLRPVEGPNTFKYAITQMIVDYAIRMTDFHLIVSNSNLNGKGRLKLLSTYKEQGFDTVLVFFDLPDSVLQERVRNSQRSKAIFRTAASFEEVLERQIERSNQGDSYDPGSEEADHFFIIKEAADVPLVIQRITALN